MGKGSFVGYETVNLRRLKDSHYYLIHMKAKGRWQILKWNKQTFKYRVFRDNLTARQAQALIILMEE